MDARGEKYQFIICSPVPYWEEPTSRRGMRIAFHLSQHPRVSRVVYLGPTRDLGQVLRGQQQFPWYWRREKVEVLGGIVPFDYTRHRPVCEPARKMSAKLVARALEKIVPPRPGVRRVFWYESPFAWVIAEHLRGFFRVADTHYFQGEVVVRGYETEPRTKSVVDWLARDRYRHADLAVFVTEVGQATAISEYGAAPDKSVVIPIAADTKKRAAIPRLAREKRVRLAGLSGPVAIYVGILGPHLDQSLLEQLAAAMPSWTFLFLGSDLRDRGPGLSRITSQKNIRFAGLIPYDKTAEYLREADVGILPLRADLAELKGIDSIKIYMYLAHGLPAVASAGLPFMGRWAGTVQFAGSPHEWAAALEAAVSSDSLERQTQRRKMAAENDWENRIAQIIELLDRVV